MSSAQLLAVVEVAQDERVRCQAAGCKHSVYKRIHIVAENGVTQVYGSECFKRLFGQTALHQVSPKYGGGEGRKLTDEERQWLVENTERLIAHFEAEHQAQLERMAQAAAALRAQATARPVQARDAPDARKAPEKPVRPLPTDAERSVAYVEARHSLQLRFPGAELDRPGFKGLLDMEAAKILAKGSPR